MPGEKLALSPAARATDICCGDVNVCPPAPGYVGETPVAVVGVGRASSGSFRGNWRAFKTGAPEEFTYADAESAPPTTRNRSARNDPPFRRSTAYDGDPRFTHPPVSS